MLQENYFSSYEVPTAVSIKIQVYRDMMPS
jgi:hypothetical protein